MPEDHDQDHDSGTGRFVSDEYAEEHPDTTQSDDVRVDTDSRDYKAGYEAGYAAGLANG